MQFQVVTRTSIEGIIASVPSIRECETWAHTEDEALDKLLERFAYFVGKSFPFQHKLDLSRKEDGEKFYTLVVRD